MAASPDKKKTVLIVLAAVLAAAAVFAAVYFLSRGPSARDFYFKAEGKNFKLYADRIKKNYADFIEEQQPYLTGDHRKRLELTAEVSSGDARPFGIQNATGIFDIIKRCKLIFDTRYSPAGKKSLSEVSLLLEKTPFADAEVFTNDRQLYFTVPVLTPDRYFTLNADRIDEVYDRFGIPVKPRKIFTLSETAKTLKFDPGLFDKGTAGLGKLIKETIGEGDISYGNRTELTLSGEKVKAREVLVRLDGNKSSELLKGLAKIYAADKDLLAYTFGNAAGLSGLLDQAGLFRLFEYLDKTGTVVLNDSEKGLVSAANIKSDAAGFVKSITEAANSLSFPDGLSMKLIIDNSGNILDRTLDVPIVDARSGRSYKTAIHTGSTGIRVDDCRNRFVEVAVDSKDSAGKDYRTTVSLNSAFTPTGKSGDEDGKIELAWSGVANGVQQGSISLKLELSGATDAATLKRKDTCRYTLEMAYAGMDKSNVISGGVDTESSRNKKLNTRNWTTDVTVKAVMPSFGVSDFSAAFRLVKEDKFGIEAFELPAVDASRTVDLNTASQEGLSKVENEILASFGVFYITNKPIIDAVLGK